MTALRVLFVVLTTVGFSTTAPAQTAKKLFFEGDIVVGDQPGVPGPGCVLRSQFKRLEKVVWRIRVLDANGNRLDAKGLKNLEVQLPDGQKFAARYGVHPPPRLGPAEDYFWTAAWTIPESYPSGTFAYKVIATDLDDQTHTWEPFTRSVSQLQVIAGAIERPQPQPKK
jgi:hypothetical protein